MREVFRGLVLSILGVIILLSLCAGMWGMAEMLSFINTNYEQAANFTPTHVTPSPTVDWVATVDAFSTTIVCNIFNAEELETAIAGTMSALEATASAYSTPTPK